MSELPLTIKQKRFLHIKEKVFSLVLILLCITRLKANGVNYSLFNDNAVLHMQKHTCFLEPTNNKQKTCIIDNLSPSELKISVEIVYRVTMNLKFFSNHCKSKSGFLNGKEKTRFLLELNFCSKKPHKTKTNAKNTDQQQVT